MLLMYIIDRNYGDTPVFTICPAAADATGFGSSNMRTGALSMAIVVTVAVMKFLDYGDTPVLTNFPQTRPAWHFGRGYASPVNGDCRYGGGHEIFAAAM
jgi:hypothetical protein